MFEWPHIFTALRWNARCRTAGSNGNCMFHSFKCDRLFPEVAESLDYQLWKVWTIQTHENLPLTAWVWCATACMGISPSPPPCLRPVSTVYHCMTRRADTQVSRIPMPPFPTSSLECSMCTTTPSFVWIWGSELKPSHLGGKCSIHWTIFFTPCQLSHFNWSSF